MTNRQLKSDLIEQASAWLSLLRSGDVTRAEHAEFESWLHADRNNFMAYEHVTGVWQDVGEMAHLKKLEPRHIAAPVNGTKVSFPDRLRGAFSLGGLRPAVLVIAVALMVGVLSYGPADENLYETQIAEIRKVVLEDGSVVTLGAQSRLAIDFTQGERRVMLSGGEAFFSVSKNPDRPFVVEVGDTLVRVVGTKFNVHAGLDRVTVAVMEGEVEVIKPLRAIGGDAPRRQLLAGQQVVTTAQGFVGPVKTVESVEAGSWRSGRLNYQDVSLRQLIFDANRYSENKILLGDEAIGDLTVTMSFQTRDIDAMFDALTSVLPIKVEQGEEGQILLKSVLKN